MSATGIKSKPVYSPLRADIRGRHHLLLGIDAGGLALLRVLRELHSVQPDALTRTRVLIVATPATIATPAATTATTTAATATTPATHEVLDALRSFDLAGLHLFDDAAALLATARAWFECAVMGTRVYVAGPEHFIGLALRLALEFGLKPDELRAEELGTTARRVSCVHCRATTEEVRTNRVRCAGCQRWLLVRDHYSRRLAAYMGVMIDAEVPGEMPELLELYV